MSIEGSLELLKELDHKTAALHRRASWVAWLSVGAACVILAILIAAGYRHLQQLRNQVGLAEKELALLDDQKRRALEDLSKVNREKDTAIKDREQAKKSEQTAKQTSYACQSIVANLDKKIVDRASGEATKLSGGVSSVPRVYLKIVDKRDREYAAQQSKLLLDHGWLVLGVEYVPNVGRALKQTEVRFCNSPDHELAQQIVRVLREHGNTTAVENDISYSKDCKQALVNQFAVWFSARPAT